MAAPFNQIHAVKKFRLNTRAKDVAGNEYVYLKGVASTVAGSWVGYDELGVTVLIDTDDATTTSGGTFVAVAQAAVASATNYGWYMIFGTCSAQAATVLDNGEVFPTSTGGQADDTGTGGMQIVGAKWRSANASGAATVQLSYPLIGVDVA